MATSAPTTSLPDFQEVRDPKDKVDAILEFCHTNRTVYPEHCLNILAEAKAVSASIDYPLGEGRALALTGFLHWHASEIEKALAEVEEGCRLLMGIQAYHAYAFAHMTKAMIIWGKGEYERAFTTIFSTVDLLEEQGEEEGRAWLYWCLGVFYYDLKDFNKSLINYQRSLDLYHIHPDSDKGILCYTLIGIGSVHTAQNNYDEALRYVQQAQDLSSKLGRWLEEARTHYEMGSIYRSLGREVEAETSFRKSYEMRKAHNTKPGMVSSLIALANLQSERKQYDSALLLLQEALQYAKETHTRPKIYHCHQQLAELYKNKGDYKKAFDHIEKFYEIKSEVAGEEASNMLKDVETKHATERSEKEKEIHRLKNVELKKAHDDIAEKNKSILDSINYARLIQEAILPPAAMVKAHLRESFILYLPKDIVAGDFYWMEAKGDELFFAVADCTGHGVPGAMVSVVCANALNRAVNEMKLKEPALILDKVRELVTETFKNSEREIQDGMDISFCRLNRQQMRLKFAGAHNALYRITRTLTPQETPVLSNGEFHLLEYKGDKQPIGKYAFGQPFGEHEIALHSGDQLFMTSDGFPDQFGGERGRKFMYKRWKELLLTLINLSPEAQHERLLETFNAWKGKEMQVDDICVMGVRV